MKNIFLGWLILALLLFAANAPAETALSVERAGWLAGCWSTESPQRQTMEVWMRPAGNAMLGMSRTVADNKMREYEFLQIAQQENGEIHYIARPSGQPEASFKLVEQTEGSLKFENPQHDFPQRILYRLQADGSLVARIEGTMYGKDKGFDYAMKRTKCD